jgi:predicted membrane-bound dolichyl-phosphate-mannose-protein mannosyltransferase
MTISGFFGDMWTQFKRRTGIDPDTNIEDRLFMYLLIVALGLRLIWLDRPIGSLIFDEAYYVNVARILAGLPWEQRVYPNAIPGLDPNLEHPPLAKLFVAASITVFGNNGYAWRLPSVIFGMFSIFAFYLLMKRLTSAKWVPLIATFMFTFDSLVFVHSRIATLDIFFVGFMLMGFYFYFANRPFLSAIMLALSTLSKLGGLYGFVVIIAYHVVSTYRKGEFRTNWSSVLTWLEKYTVAYVLVGLGLLTILDWGWTSFKTPSAAFAHMDYIYRYTTALVRDPLEGIESYPWQWWFLNQVEIPYLRVVVNIIDQSTGAILGSRASVEFLGKMNWVVLALSWFSMPYAVWDYYKNKTSLSLFAIIWFASTYLTWYPASIFGHRIMYIHYFLPTIPAISATNANAIVGLNLPRVIVIAIAALVLIAFGFYFPFKGIP